LIFSEVAVSCADCHDDIHQGELGLRCDNCHTPFSWENRRELFEEHSRTNFPLIGVHANVDCEACHYSPQKQDISRLPIECEGCHLEVFLSSKNPNHQAAQFSENCEQCHLLQALRWENTTFQHLGEFKLEGAHNRIECIDCHTDVYAGTSKDCYPCHTQVYQQTTDPNHKTFGFLTECQLCHTTTNWETSSFDHLAVTGFPLIGAHQQAPCISCHVNNQTTGLPLECYGCHQSDYTTAADPNHVINNFDKNCLACHSENAWSPSSFDHNNSAFPLTGAHLTVLCIDCHQSGYAGTPTDCYSCHDDDYIAVQDPNHVTNNFSRDCLVCHNDVAWTPATFDHAATAFPLTGAHQTVLCIDCHQSGYAGTPTDCYSCHDDDYQNAQNPNHIAAGFPQQCETCHNTSNWNQTTWNHDILYFPIYSGSHQGEWTVCADCHVDPNNYLTFECILCHEHNDPIDLLDKHRGVAGYQYLSTACYNCHPTGEN
jgi:nitrate/TMAO reductase-like tetraheme cytochrome c subunit